MFHIAQYFPITDPTLIFFVVLLIILFAPIIMGKLRIPHIIGMVLAGVLIGKYGLNILERDSSFELFGKVGLYYIMFLAALEMDMEGMKKNKSRLLIYGLLTCFIPFFLTYGMSIWLLHYSAKASFLLSCIMASNTLIAYPIVSRYGLQQKPSVTLSVGSSMISLLIALIMLAGLVASFSKHDGVLFWVFFTLKFAAYCGVMIMLIPRLTRWFLRRYSDAVMQFIFVLSMLFMSAALSQIVGIEGVFGALIVGAVLGIFGISWLDGLMNFIATVYTRLFQLLAVPTIALAVITTLASLGNQADTGKIFRHAITYTLLTTIAAAAVGLVLYNIVSPGNLPTALVQSGMADVPQKLGETSYYDHILGVIPNNIIKPFAEGNVLSILILAAAAGIALAKMPSSDKKEVVMKGLFGLQDLLFMLIHGLIWALPLGIVAFAAQLSAQFSAGIVMASLGKYVAVILGGNVIQFFIILPLFLLARGLNPVRTLGKMMPAVLMALFTKSSAATLPVTMQTAEDRLGVSNQVSRFVLPICTTINMNGCAAFILVTSLFLMQNGGMPLPWTTMILWLFISVISAVGNAGVPMGCYFLTLSLMSGINAPIGIMGIILPIYTIIDMIETAENVWSDSCVCAMVDRDLKR
jgi:Na+/H+-dicarboxylate symporter